MIIPDWLKVRKQTLEIAITPAIIVLVGVGAFGLGRLSAAPARGTLIIRGGGQLASPAEAANPRTDASVMDASSPQSGNFVASKSGTKYYLPSCSGARTIKEENKVWFTSAAEAKAAGYEPAANCKGL